MQHILIVGAGFAGMYAALNAARLRDEQGVSPDTLDIAVVAPEPRLVIRPRLYEAAPETMVAPLVDVFNAVDVRYEQGMVDVIDSAGKSVTVDGSDGGRRSLPYDRLVLAAGSQGFKPDVPQTVYVATGANFPDGLAGGPVAGLAPGPLLLVPSNTLPSVVAAELFTMRASVVLALGGWLVIEGRITDGTYPPGSQLSGVLAIVTEFGIAQMTARRVLTELRATGLAQMQVGVGTFVTQLPKPPTSP